MALAAVTPRQPGQRTLPDRTWQRRQRTPAASRSRGGCTQGPRPRLRGPWALIFVVLGVLLLVKPASAMSIRKDEVPQQLSAPLEWIRQQNLCPPGFYMEEVSGGCAPCTDGTDYTNHSNTLPSCLPCTTCKSEEEEKNRCTSSKDTECQCKPGTFRGEDAPEFCQKCSAGCPDGKVMVMNCTPWSNVKCVDQESGTLAHGEAPVPGELATMSRRLPITPCPSSGTSPLVTNIFTGLGITVVITFVLIGCVVCCFSKDSGCPACSHRPGALCSVSVPGEGGAARGPSPPLSGVSSLLGCFGECCHKEKKLTEDNAQSQDEASRESGGPSMKTKAALHCVLQKPAASEGSQGRRWLLVPTDATESLKLFFSDFAAISPL
ncbi:tumor necrosis factor receptor superfamily member 10A-like isoform X5 [Cervus canadensis]|uniref:tumor necrosis factor receptor superfamily member 10A-like isoform X5 n=1 Tax=Cervus canadensis TaxID=1574408 RepID=UPI001CA33E2F|nr:tumor necrosis factor receptor superfamily member 10A-like isoform X5 [Cervus canadensis]